MSWHQLVIELGREPPGRAEEACLALGAISLSLADAGDEPLLEPAPGDTPLWREVRLKALFEEALDPALLAATLTAVLALPAGAIPLPPIADGLLDEAFHAALSPGAPRPESLATARAQAVVVISFTKETPSQSR